MGLIIINHFSNFGVFFIAIFRRFWKYAVSKNCTSRDQMIVLPSIHPMKMNMDICLVVLCEGPVFPWPVASGW